MNPNSLKIYESFGDSSIETLTLLTPQNYGRRKLTSKAKCMDWVESRLVWVKRYFM